MLLAVLSPSPTARARLPAQTSDAVAGTITHTFIVYGVDIQDTVRLTLDVGHARAGDEIHYTMDVQCVALNPDQATQKADVWWGFGTSIYFLDPAGGPIPTLQPTMTPVVQGEPAPASGAAPPDTPKCDSLMHSSSGAFLVPPDYVGRTVRVSVGQPRVDHIVVNGSGVPAPQLSYDAEGQLPELVVTKSTWNRQKALDYAERWSANGRQARNPAYPINGDDDSTNFVSQVLHAGGLDMQPGSSNSSHAWWATTRGWLRFWPFGGGSSRTWTTAAGLATFLSASGVARPVILWEDVRPGDIVQVDYRGPDGSPRPDGRMDLSLIVSKIVPGHADPMDNLVFTYHSVDHRDVPAQYIRGRLPAQAQFQVWHVS